MVYLKFSFSHGVYVKILFFKMLRMLEYRFDKNWKIEKIVSLQKLEKVNGKKFERYTLDRVFDGVSNDVFHLWLIGIGVTLFAKQTFSRAARLFWGQSKECYRTVQIE